MKKLLFLMSLAVLFAVTTSQIPSKDTNPNLATVRRVRGVPVFVMCEPNAAYEATGKVSDDDASSILKSIDGQSSYRTINESCNVIVDNAQRKQKKGKLTFDAILISDDGHTGTCIKFKTEEK